MKTSNAFFVQRLNDHIQYLRRVTNTLKGEDDFHGSSHTQCKLGRWLYSEGKDDLGACMPEGRRLFESLLAKHQHFHDVSDDALAKHAAGDYINSYRAMTEMLKLSGELVSLLLEADQHTRAALAA